MDNTETAPPGAEHPGEAAFRRGCQALEADWDSAGALFEEAVRRSGREMLWRVTEAYLGSEEAGQWMRRAVASESEPGGITVAPGTLGIVSHDESDFRQVWDIAVESDDDALAVVALNAAADRMWTVLEDGRERSPEEAAPRNTSERGPLPSDRRGEQDLDGAGPARKRSDSVAFTDTFCRHDHERRSTATWNRESTSPANVAVNYPLVKCEKPRRKVGSGGGFPLFS
ncbi:hypothetical protein ACFUN8_14430 [Streptomyces sp. NPDC057307]|uniref:hypothetical protein n=1 Tax=Streptomyces sp. NPDC057307 TaxID=3346096 RepID=UPI003638A0D4